VSAAGSSAGEVRARPASRSVPAPSFVPAGERILIAVHPSPWLIVLSSARVLLIVALLAGGAGVVSPILTQAAAPGWLVWGLVGIGAAKLVWELLDWVGRAYILTDRRVLRAAGVLRRHIADMPLDRVQHMTLDRTLGERVLGLGTIGFATAGAAGMEAYWIAVDHPEERIERVRSAMAMAGRGAGLGSAGRGRPVVIGLAGAIGAGKTRVAQEFGRLGAVVIDSDAEAKRMLDHPDIREKLRGWWGERVIGTDGRIDRSEVARVIFSDPAQRRRLEALIHPLVKEHRAGVIARAQRDGAAAVVVDAPLLFEAGVDAECDAIVFVDAPREARLARVRASRGWTAEELSRRESQQMDAEEKRRKSDHVIANTGDEGSVARQAGLVYRAILSGVPGVRGFEPA
jgi:dephospho-CoA kinase